GVLVEVFEELALSGHESAEHGMFLVEAPGRSGVITESGRYVLHDSRPEAAVIKTQYFTGMWGEAGRL
ncbi:hypothetical protein, partial [Cupriavidus basilensis]|uniref:hypothetical protein n=1 Tax=Cupriavidus basilensis TaxID=68895 RepID=UPI001300C827